MTIFVRGRCFTCGGSGMKVVHRQDDVVPSDRVPPGIAVPKDARLFWASTVYETCDCMTITAQPTGVAPP